MRSRDAAVPAREGLPTFVLAREAARDVRQELTPSPCTSRSGLRHAQLDQRGGDERRVRPRRGTARPLCFPENSHASSAQNSHAGGCPAHATPPPIATTLSGRRSSS